MARVGLKTPSLVVVSEIRLADTEESRPTAKFYNVHVVKGKQGEASVRFFTKVPEPRKDLNPTSSLLHPSKL